MRNNYLKRRLIRKLQEYSKKLNEEKKMQELKNKSK